MPLYPYECILCRQMNDRWAGVDDHRAVCHACGGLMLRRDTDLFGPYFAGREEKSHEDEAAL
jgi:predicted nucleic acid-binding Zn ribbon protein